MENKRNKLLEIVPFIGLLFVIIFFQIVSQGKLISVGNRTVLINQIFSTAIGATGVIFVMAQGNLDFSMGAIVGIVAAAAALVSKQNILLTLPVAILLGGSIGAINGFAHTILKVPAFIATVCVSFILKGITNIVLDSGSLGANFKLGVYDTVLIKTVTLIIIMIVGFIIFEFYTFGKHSRAIGAREEVAKQSGVNIIKTKILAFMASGVACGIVAFFSIARSSTASTSTGANFEVDVLIALMLGGLPVTGGWNSRFRNAVIGSMIMAIVANGLTLWGINTFDQQLIRGFVFIVAVAVSFDRKNVVIIK